MARAALIAVIVSLLTLRTSSLQSFMAMPVDTEVEAGASVTLECAVAELGGECRWEREGLPVGAERGKYEMEECNMRILEAEHQYDGGQWVCQVSASDIEAGDSLVSNPASLTVIKRPNEVSLVMSGHVILYHNLSFFRFISKTQRREKFTVTVIILRPQRETASV